MNTDELRRMLELAARACGAQIEPCVCSSQPFRFKATKSHFSPHVDDGASARMRTALRMNVIWSDTAMRAMDAAAKAFEEALKWSR